MVWINFPLYAGATLFFWLIGLMLLNLNKNKKRLSLLLLSLGILVLISFTVQLWVLLERPPLRTLGETRLWYSLFLPIVGIITFFRWRYKWFITYTFGLAALFLVLNLAHPENYNKTLMPALRSIWFVPHVLVYIIS